MPTLGIIGGGQLAKMLAQAAAQLGCETIVLERDPHSSAAHVATRTVTGDWDDPEALRRLGALVDVVTLENEFVSADSLAVLGNKLVPSAECVRVVQDKLWQKQALAQAGLPVPAFAEKPDATFGWPMLLKKRRYGYDGKGNATVRSPAEFEEARTRLGGDVYVEEFCDFKMELATIVTGQVTYPIVETIQRDHICHIVKAPAQIPASVAATAADIARRAVAAVGGAGSFGVEMFLTGDGRVLINELAPRVHNSGHYTIEACACSQFENHVRAVFGWPLGAPTMRAPAAVMVNLLGDVSGYKRALAVEGAHVHIYGKRDARPGRKMGHVTALGDSMDEAIKIAQRAADLVRCNP